MVIKTWLCIWRTSNLKSIPSNSPSVGTWLSGDWPVWSTLWAQSFACRVVHKQERMPVPQMTAVHEHAYLSQRLQWSQKVAKALGCFSELPGAPASWLTLPAASSPAVPLRRAGTPRGTQQRAHPQLEVLRPHKPRLEDVIFPSSPSYPHTLTARELSLSWGGIP